MHFRRRDSLMMCSRRNKQEEEIRRIKPEISRRIISLVFDFSCNCFTINRQLSECNDTEQETTGMIRGELVLVIVRNKLNAMDTHTRTRTGT